MGGEGISIPVAYSRLIREGHCSTQEEAQHSKQQEWIWEYVLKNCKDFSVTTKLLDALPIPDTPLIKKLAILKLLSLDTETGWYAERDLFALQGFERLIRGDGEEDEGGGKEGIVGDEKSRKRKRRQELNSLWSKLYLLVKAELALQHLRGDREDWDSFNSALDRHWGEVVQDTEEPLLCESNDLKCDLWSLKSNHRLKNFLLGEHKRDNVDELVKRFLALAWEDVGPVLLEKVVEDMSSGRYAPLGKKPACDENGDAHKNKRVRKTLLASLEEEEAGSPVTRPPWRGETSEKQGTRKLRRRSYNGNTSRTLDVEKAVSELKTSQQNLMEQVRDPLPEAIQVARKIREDARPNGFSTEQQGQAQTTQQEKAQHDGNQQQEQPSGDGSDVSKQQQKPPDADGAKDSRPLDHGKGKPSFMDRNHTARTFQWDDDDIENSPADLSPSASKRLNLPSGTALAVSPLRQIEPSKATLRRRKIKRWTPREEEALRKGVDRYGKGRWKAILQSNLDVFENRTEVDLKDKWRNIERAEGIKREY